MSDGGSAHDARRLLEALAELPGGPQLLELAGSREDMALVGGATRDLLLGRTPRELDVVLDEGAVSVARELAASIGGSASPTVTAHERFGTAAVDWEQGRVDIAERRAESYASPGALPDVRAGTAEEDLRRRDFTVNAIAAPLGGSLRGTLLAPPGALADLAARRLRVLHDDSFLDDPTRLLRLARYGAQLGFAPEEHTAELASRALANGAMATVSRARVGAELRLALAEQDPVAALGAISALGVLERLEPWLRFDGELARRALEVLPGDGRPDLLLLAQLLGLPGEPPGEREREMFRFLDELEFPASDRERAIGTALGAPSVIAALRAAGPPSRMHEALASRTPEAVALAAALAGEAPDDGTVDAARRWLGELRHVSLSITGDDLLLAGVAQGPEVGRRLTAALHRKLDGELADGRDAELQAALEAVV